ncbi:MAG: (E)-4-hydroxy-3-methylbut-2-enyl-diphosphate synthase [Saprospiraceae bacterium]|nr:(E)-4-hydroxy-3-methylbut-2-enyl-diphosphate synthase [Saprospiraceae bacterium]
MSTTNYCPSLTNYKRFLTREVHIGSIPLGAHHPIRVQSMTTTDTMDTAATVAQSIRMIEAGCEYVRITAPSKKEAENLAEIKKQLRASGFDTPLVADIHFTPNAAEIAARLVEKVRVNPGNYADKKKFNIIEYSDVEYEAELERIREKFTPLVRICKEYGTAMRIGTNHGSLSDRIMSRYGDTPLGMVESAMEFLRICEAENYHNIVLSMKASNTQVMVQAYRLLVAKMMEAGQNYPLHLGVTEAGDGEDGRTKSAVGIGALLEDGLGDTVRVSLTEEPEAEMPVARKLIDRYSNRSGHPPIEPISSTPIDPYSYSRRDTAAVLNVGKDQVPIVIADLSQEAVDEYDNYAQIGFKYNAQLDKYSISDSAADFVYLADKIPSIELPGGLKPLYDYGTWASLDDAQRMVAYPLLTMNEWKAASRLSSTANFISVQADNFHDILALDTSKAPAIFLVETANAHAMPAIRRLGFELIKRQQDTPIVIRRKYAKSEPERLTLDASADIGPLFIDGIGNGIMLSADKTRLESLNQLAFGILQATRTRISKTEYISCPSCGRTLFDLQETTAMIRSRTNHLKGVKIGIMGCIVNGPGEMADADYGYVGSGVGKITLYRGQDVVKRGIPSEDALDELIEIIREDGNWVEVVNE